ncbi:MAG TPA: VWA domain-containing protein [Thermoanaerobaculia bacterium]|nr:VWA domain-containing protein [Thermoanaerobaculia bacterium]
MRSSLAFLVTVLFAQAVMAARVEIVLDVSGSMRASAGNMSRMEAAQRAVKATIEAIDSSSNVALRLYGHRLPSEPKDPSCRDTELVIPFGPLDRQRFIAAVESAKPLGQTPLAYALEQAAADFGGIGDEPVAVILVSDGEESCGGDPARVACAFRERGLELTVHTVGFDVGDVARKQLQAIASCTGGEYRDARNAGELAESLRQLTQAGLLIEKEREGRGNVVRGGNGFDSAVKLTPGTYRLDHHQRPSEYDYFAVDVTPGNLLVVRQVAFELGVEIKGDTFKETSQDTYQFVAIGLYAPDKSKIRDARAWGVGKKAEVGGSVRAGRGGTYYVAVGGEHFWRTAGIHKESPFTIELIDVSDAGSGTDAGDSDRDAVRIEPGKQDAWFQPGDSKDTYWFDAVAGTAYAVVARPEADLQSLKLTVSDDDRVTLAEATAPNEGAAVRAENIRPARSGRVYVTLSYPDYMKGLVLNPVRYSIELTATGGPPPTATGGPLPTATESEPKAAQAAESKSSLIDRIPGGRITCAVLLGLGLLGLIAIVVLVIILKRKSKGTS